VIAPVSGRPTAFFGDLRGTMYAVNAATGELLWEKKLDEIGTQKKSA